MLLLFQGFLLGVAVLLLIQVILTEIEMSKERKKLIKQLQELQDGMKVMGGKNYDTCHYTGTHDIKPLTRQSIKNYRE